MPHSHNHTTPIALNRGGSPTSYGAVVGKLETSTEKPIQGRNGDHLQFYLSIGGGQAYQVDVNTQSRDGSQIGLYIAEEPLDSAPDFPLGPSGDASLSYKGIGLSNAEFANTDYTRIEGQLEADLNRADLVVAYGLTFDDGPGGGMGLHETHYTGRPNQDGALALYLTDGAATKRVWYFFKFQEDSIP